MISEQNDLPEPDVLKTEQQPVEVAKPPETPEELLSKSVSAIEQIDHRYGEATAGSRNQVETIAEDKYTQPEDVVMARTQLGILDQEGRQVISDTRAQVIGSVQPEQNVPETAPEQTPEELRTERLKAIINEIEEGWEKKNGSMERPLSKREIEERRYRTEQFGQKWDGATTKMTERATDFYFGTGGGDSVPAQANRILSERFPEYAEKSEPAVKLEQKVFDQYVDDPYVKQYEDEILKATNTDSSLVKAQEAGKASGPDGYSAVWNRVNFNIQMNRWDSFVTRFPEKAKTYADQGHQGISDALARATQRKAEPNDASRSSTSILNEQERNRFAKSGTPLVEPAVVAGGTEKKDDDFEITIDGISSNSSKVKKPDDDFEITLDGKSSRTASPEDVDITIDGIRPIDDVDITIDDIRMIDQRFAELPAANNDVDIEIISTREIPDSEKTEPSVIKNNISIVMRPLLNQHRKMFPGMSPESMGLSSTEQNQRRISLRAEMRRQELDKLPQLTKGIQYRSERPLGRHFNQEQGYSCTLASTLNAMESLGQRSNLTERQLAQRLGEDGSESAIGVEKTLDYLKENGFSVNEVGSVSEVISELVDGKVVMMTVPGNINHRVVISAFEVRDGNISFLWNDPLKKVAHWTSLEAVANRFVYDPDMAFMCESIGRKAGN